MCDSNNSKGGNVSKTTEYVLCNESLIKYEESGNDTPTERAEYEDKNKPSEQEIKEFMNYWSEQ